MVGSAPDQPTGVVTFLMSDVEGSTSLLQHLGRRAFIDIMEQHQRLMRGMIVKFGGWEMGTEGDSFSVAFQLPSDAIGCAVTAQVEMASQPWFEQVRVRMGLHVGEVAVAGDNYIGMPVHVAARIAATAWGGQVVASQAVVDQVELPDGVTATELGRFSLKDVGDHLLYQLGHADLSASFLPLRARGSSLVVLPAALTTLLGRADHVAAAADTIKEHRLVTLVGPGGIGKTRLALAVAADLVDKYPGGVWWVELAGVADDSEAAVWSAVIDAVVEGSSGATDQAVPLSQLHPHLGAAPALLVIDNCEHVVTSVAKVVKRLLEEHELVTVATTSRVALGLALEQLHPVPALDVPRSGESLTRDDLDRYPALELFVERARAAAAPFSDGDLDAIGALVRQLEGLPLAIELAAARSRSFSASELSDRVGQSLSFLRSSDPTGDSRQSTLNDTIAWSWNLLCSEERAVLRRLSIFRAPIHLLAAETVCAGDPVEDGSVADHLDTLVRHSLLSPERRDERTLFSFHPLVRQFALGCLEEAGERDSCMDRLGDWLVGYAASLQPSLDSLTPDQALAELDTHSADVLAGLGHLVHDRPEDVVMTANRLTSWIQDRGHQRIDDLVGTIGESDLADPAARLLRELWHVHIGRQSSVDLDEAGKRLIEDGVLLDGWFLRGAAAARARRDHVDVDVLRQSLEAIDGSRQWLDLVIYAVRTDGTPQELRHALRDRLLELGELHGRPSRFHLPDIALSLAEDGRLEEARHVLQRGLALAEPPPSLDHWTLHVSVVGIESLADRVEVAIPNLEELALLRDRHADDPAIRHPPVGTSGRASALLETLGGSPVLPPDTRDDEWFGWALELALVDAYREVGAVDHAVEVMTTGPLRRPPPDEREPRLSNTFFLALAGLAVEVGDVEWCHHLHAIVGGELRRQPFPIFDRLRRELAATVGASAPPSGPNPLADASEARAACDEWLSRLR